MRMYNEALCDSLCSGMESKLVFVVLYNLPGERCPKGLRIIDVCFFFFVYVNQWVIECLILRLSGQG